MENSQHKLCDLAILEKQVKINVSIFDKLSHQYDTDSPR